MAAEINLTVNSNTIKAQADLDNYVLKSAKVREEVKKFRASFDGKELEAFADKARLTAAAVTATDGPLKGMKAEQKLLKKEIQSNIKNGMDPQSDQLKELSARYDKLTMDIGQVEAAQKKELLEKKKATAAAKANSDATKANTTAQGRANTAFGTGAKKLLGMAAAYVSVRQASAFITDAAKDAIEYTEGIANINTMIDITAEQYAVLDQELTRVSETYAMQKTELTAGIYQAVSAGAADLADALNIVESSAILAKGALMTNAEAVDIVTTAINAYGPGVMTSGDAVDSFFTIIKKGKINGEELSGSIGKSISLFAQAKIPLDQLGAGIATLTKVGVEASSTTTQLNAVVAGFIKPSAAMTAALEDSGYASGSALLEAEGLAGALEFLGEKTDGDLDKIGALIPSIRGIKGIAAATSNDMATFNEVMADFADKADAGTEAASKQTDGFSKEAFVIAQAKIKFENYRIEIGEKFLPVAVVLIENIEKIGIALVSMVAGMVVFTLFAKGAIIIKGVAGAFVALNAAIAANPIGAIAMVITTVLIPVIIYLYNNWDLVIVNMLETTSKLQAKIEVAAGAIKVAYVVAANAIRIAFSKVVNYLGTTFLDAAKKALGWLQDVPFMSGWVDKAMDSIDKAKGSVEEYAKGVEEESRQAQILGLAAYNSIKAQSEGRIIIIGEEADARRKALEAAKDEQLELDALDTAVDPGAAVNPDDATDELETSLSERLSILNNAHVAELEEFDSFLADRMTQEGIAGDARIDFLNAELAKIQNLESISDDEKITAKEAVNARIADITAEGLAATAAAELAASEKSDALAKETAEARAAALKSSLQSTASIVGSMGDILGAFDGESRASAITQKILASAQAGINSYLAFTEVLADPSFVGRPVTRGLAAGAVLAAGLAQQANIIATPITAETGTGHFGVTIPSDDSSRAADSIAVKASPGERVDVTPRGESRRQMRIIVNISNKAIVDTVTDAIDSGDIIISTDNIQGIA